MPFFRSFFDSYKRISLFEYVAIHCLLVLLVVVNNVCLLSNSLIINKQFLISPRVQFIQCSAAMLFLVFGLGLSLVSFVNAEWFAGKQVNTLLGVSTGVTDKNEVYGAGYNGNKGFVFYSADRANLPGSLITTGDGINFDLTLSPDKSSIIVVGANAIYYGQPQGDSTTFKKASFGDVVSQDVQPIRGMNTGVAAIGRFDGVNGVSVTTDGGVSWSTYDLGVDSNTGLNARYGSFPTSTTWYVGAGTWPYQTDAKLTNGNVARISSRLSVFYDVGDGTPQITFISARNLLGTYPGAIFKTTDSGQTFTQVYNSAGKHFINQIDCFDDLNCFAAGEDAQSAVILSTTDGGLTWQKKLELFGPYSLHSVKMISVTEIFVGGGRPSVGPFITKDIEGYYYHTTDGGQNWSLQQFNGYGYDFSFWDDGSQGFAASLLRRSSYFLIWQ